MPSVGDNAPDVGLLDAHGAPCPLSSAWQAGPAVLVFLRYFGCPFCQTQVAQLADHEERLAERGASVVLIGQGTPNDASWFSVRRPNPFPLLLDPERDAYRAFGLERTHILRVLDPRLAVPFVRANVRADTGQAGLHGGDFFQLPGTFIVGRDGRIRYAHRYRHIADHPSVHTILGVLDAQD